MGGVFLVTELFRISIARITVFLLKGKTFVLTLS